MRRLERDAVALFYEEAGEGEPPVLLVHGWCCDHTYFSPQFKHFAEQGHRVVAVDLRGHGQSDKPRQHYSMQVFADDLAWMCERLELTKPVLVGHSMGGRVAFDFAVRYSQLTSAVVLPFPVSSRSCAARTTGRRCAGMWPRPSSSPPTTKSARSASWRAWSRPRSTRWCRPLRARATTTPRRRLGGRRC